MTRTISSVAHCCRATAVGPDDAGTSASLGLVRSGAEIVVETLCAGGISTFFGIPGGPIINVFDAIVRNPKATLIQPRQETFGAFSAMGFFRATGLPSAVVVTAGPGGTNVVTGVVAAHLERVPMVVISGDVAWERTGRKLAQDSGPYGTAIERMLHGSTRRVVRVTSPGAAAGQVRAAMSEALAAGCPGPVLVIVSASCAGASSAAPRLAYPVSISAPTPCPPEPALVDEIATRLRRADRPLIVVGAGCRQQAAAVSSFVDAANVPFVTTPQAKGTVSEHHPLSLRTCGMSASWWARRYTQAEPDLVVVLGTDLDDSSTAGTPPVGKTGTLVHVDSDSTVFNRNFPTAIGACCDVGSFSQAMATRLIAAKPSAVCNLLRSVKETSPFDCPEFRTDASFPIAPHRVIGDLERAVGPEATFVTDIGEHMLFALHYLTATAPDKFVVHLGLGSMGSGIASAIGLALGDRKRRVVCVCGDGCMQMAGMELLGAVKHRLPILYAVFNDSRYNMVHHGYRYNFDRLADWTSPTVDFAQWARSLGAVGKTIRSAGEITPSLVEELLSNNLPVVLDIRQNSDLRIRGDGRLEAIRQMSLPQGD